MYYQTEKTREKRERNRGRRGRKREFGSYLFSLDLALNSSTTLWNMVTE